MGEGGTGGGGGGGGVWRFDSQLIEPGQDL